MKLVLPLLFGILGLAAAAAQDRVSVAFKVFPTDYEVFSGGERLGYTPRSDGNRTYQLPAGPARVNLTAPGMFPLSLAFEVKAGMAAVEAKLEPRQGPLSFVGETATGKLPRGLAFSSDGRRLFVALQAENGIEVYDVPSLKKAGRFSAADGAAGFADVLAVSEEIWAIQRDGTLRVIDPATLAVKQSVALGLAGNAGLSEAGPSRVAVAHWDNAVVTIVDTATKKTVATTAVAGNLRGFAFAGSTGYATLFDLGKVVTLENAGWKTTGGWAAGKAPRPVAALGSTVFVGDMGSAQVLVVQGSSGKVLKTVAVPSNPHQMAAAPAQGLVAVASRGRNNPVDYQLAGPEFGRVTLMDAQGTVLGTVWGRNQPMALAFSADAKYLAFADFLDGNVELYRISR